MDISQLSPTVFLGNAGTSKYPEALRDLGISAVVRLTPDYWGWTQNGFQELAIPIDDGGAIHERYLKLFLEQMHQWIFVEQRKVLIHCHMGISRTSAFAIFWLMSLAGCSAQTEFEEDTDLRTEWSKAEDRVRDIRPQIEPHWMLKQSILNYFHTL